MIMTGSWRWPAHVGHRHYKAGQPESCGQVSWTLYKAIPVRPTERQAGAAEFGHDSRLRQLSAGVGEELPEPFRVQGREFLPVGRRLGPGQRGFAGPESDAHEGQGVGESGPGFGIPDGPALGQGPAPQQGVDDHGDPAESSSRTDVVRAMTGADHYRWVSAPNSDGSAPSRTVETPHGMLTAAADMNREPDTVSEGNPRPIVNLQPGHPTHHPACGHPRVCGGPAAALSWPTAAHCYSDGQAGLSTLPGRAATGFPPIQ